MNASHTALLEAAARPYRAAGCYAYHFARNKLRHDPVFIALLREGLIADDMRVLDLGCGQYLLAALLLGARQQYERGNWPGQWPRPPRPRALHGVELLVRDVERARRALGTTVELVAGDIREASFPPADVIVILDVLHYLTRAQQDAVLRKARDALASGGRLLLRVADPHAGLRFTATRVGDRFGALLRGEWRPRHCHRPLAQWTDTLETLGFSVRQQPMSAGTPFANVLLVADKRN